VRSKSPNGISSSRKDTPWTTRRKRTSIFDGLAAGDGKPFRDSLADDFSWHMIGSTAWSGSYRGKQAVLQELMRPLFANFETTYRNRPVRIIAEGEWVVVECRGEVMTKSGEPYNNEYCWVCRVQDGQLKELTEYMDTQLVERALRC
jgi:ketosteroid isomerase-like protein